MDEKIELLEYIYQDTEMAVASLNDLLKELNDKDNKIKKDVENLLKGYERYFCETKKMLKHEDSKPISSGFMAKIGAKMGIKKEVKEDNSDASIADMLIKGISMGTLDMEKHIKNYEAETDARHIEFARDFLQFGQDNITAFKKYL